MQEHERPYTHKSPTIVLQKRRTVAFEAQNNGLKTGCFVERAHAPPAYQVRQSARAGPSVRGPTEIRRAQQQDPQREADLLVRFGIDTMLGRMVTRMLVMLLLLQPVYVALAVELDQVPEDVSLAEATAVSASTDLDEGTTVAVSDLESDEGAVVSGDEALLPDSAPVPSELVPQEHADLAGNGTADAVLPLSEEEAASSTEPDGSDDTSSAVLPDLSLLASTTVSDEGAPSGAEATEPGHVHDASSTTDALPATSDEHASTTEDLPVDEVEERSNRYTFGEGDCTLVADGEFYCIATDVRRHVPGDPRVYAEKDREGDREIYYFDGVEVKRITNNGYDDLAPMIDADGKRIVWQAMINDRLQIMVHELGSGVTRQVTQGRSNSSNPFILGDKVVWQEWVDTNWEIMLADVSSTDGDYRVEQLTDNVVHDMFPQLYQGLVTWQREKGNSWEVIVYDLRTGSAHALPKQDDTKYENPRFVLLFDSRHENGDVATIGYELESGEMVELGTRARPIPANPQTPDDETPDALPRTASSTSEQKPVREDGDDDQGL